MSDRHLAVQTLSLDMLAGLGGFIGIVTKPVNNEAVIGRQIGHQRTVARSHVNDQPTLDARAFHQILR